MKKIIILSSIFLILLSVSSASALPFGLDNLFKNEQIEQAKEQYGINNIKDYDLNPNGEMLTNTMRIQNLNTIQNRHIATEYMNNNGMNCIFIDTMNEDYYLQANNGIVNVCNQDMTIKLNDKDTKEVIEFIEDSMQDGKISSYERIKAMFKFRNLNYQFN